MAYTFEDKKSDAGTAFQNALRYHRELKEIYRYFTPYREPTSERTPSGGKTEGENRTNQIFDGTGPSAAAAFVSNMKSDWMPAFEDFFTLKNGPLYEGKDKEGRAEALQKVTRIVHGLTRRIRATATEEMFGDLFAGTGALCVQPGTVRQPLRGFSVPILEIALENGPYSDVERWWWKRKWKAREVEAMIQTRWPKGKIPPKLAEVIAKDRNALVEVTQFTYWNDAAGNFEFCVWTDKDDVEIFSEEMSTSPWITPRMYVAPGETFGRGYAHLGLPGVKTVNKARELALRAAAFALLGLWTRRTDGVFNPKTSALIPGAFWKVASNGTGHQGPSIARLDVPHNFDVSTVVINDEREQIRRVLFDDELPEITDRVRSPTEIAGRMRRYERMRGGATTRLAFELVTPFVERAVDCLGQMRLLPKDIRIDDILTQAEVSAPAAAAQRTDRVDRTVAWLQIMIGLFGPQAAALNSKIEDLLPELGRDLGVDERFIRKKTEHEQLKALIDNAVQVALKEQKGGPAAKPLEPEVGAEQAFLNGGL